MRLIHTEYYGFLHLVDLFDDRLCYEIRPFIDDDILLEITGYISSFGGFSLEDMISTRECEFVDIEFDTLDLERCEESIIDPPSERILIDGFAKIVVGIDIIISLRSCSETEMHSTREISEYLSPVPIFSSTTTMTLIDDDHIEKIGIIARVVGFENFIWILFIDSACECLIDRKENIGICWNLASFFLDETPIDFDDIFLERIESIHRLIDEDIAIREDEDTRSTNPDSFLGPTSIEKFIGNLKCDHRLSCSCGECQENSVFFVSEGFHDFVDCDLLIVSWSFVGYIIRFSHENFFHIIFLREYASIQLIWMRIFFYEVSFPEFEIEFIDLLSIGRVDKPDIQDLSIFFYLFESLGWIEIVLLGFYDGEIHSIYLEDIICEFLLPCFATDELASEGEVVLTHHKRIHPTILTKLRIDIFRTSVGFGVSHTHLRIRICSIVWNIPF